MGKRTFSSWNSIRTEHFPHTINLCLIENTINLKPLIVIQQSVSDKCGLSTRGLLRPVIVSSLLLLDKSNLHVYNLGLFVGSGNRKHMTKDPFSQLAVPMAAYSIQDIRTTNLVPQDPGATRSLGLGYQILGGREHI